MRWVFALLGILLMSIHTDAQRPAAPRSPAYPQLLATLYPTGTALPAGVKKPAVDYAFVDRAGLPNGAVLLISYSNEPRAPPAPNASVCPSGDQTALP